MKYLLNKKLIEPYPDPYHNNRTCYKFKYACISREELRAILDDDEFDYMANGVIYCKKPD